MHTKHKVFKPATTKPAIAGLLLTALLLIGAAVSEPVLADKNVNHNRKDQSAATAPQVEDGHRIQTDAEYIPKIQLAILLDTSNSMDGLIDMARNQLWQVVNEFSSAKQNGITPVLELALFEYGNDGLSRSNGYVRKLSGFTRELDQVSESLFALTTNGGSEYCGVAIKTALEQLQWSQSGDDIKSIFIAGNESFAQGPFDYRQAAELATQMGVAINTIHAGGHQAGMDGGWHDGAILAGGDYTSIDANQQIVHVNAPQDEKIAELNTRLNQTYVPYGDEGANKVQRQAEQDSLSGGISVALLAKRVKSKVSSFYRNSSWDLVDALNEGRVDEDQLAELEEQALPAPMQGLSATEKLEYVAGKADERKLIQQEITELSRARDAHVAQVKSEQAAAAPDISDALTAAVRKQAADKKFEFAE